MDQVKNNSRICS